MSAVSWKDSNSKQPPIVVASNIAMIDANNFVFASSVRFKDTNDNSNNGIFNYNTQDDKWTLLAKYPRPTTVVPTSFHSICYDADNQRIFIQGYEKKLIICNLHDQTWKVHILNKQIGSFTHLLSINGELNLIGGASNKCHLIWDKDINQFKQIFKFSEWESGNYGAGLAYLKSKRTLMLFGGYDYITFNILDTIWIHKIGTRMWSKFNVLPCKLYMFGYVLTSDEKFIIVFGGESKEEEATSTYLDDIWILDIVENQWRKSRVKCPSKGLYYAVLMSNRANAIVLVYGWIRKLFNITILPVDIISLITDWYCRETIHLFKHNEKQHWQLELDQILN